MNNIKTRSKNHPILFMDNIFERNAIRFKWMPTLQHMSAVKVVTNLWAEKNMMDKVKKRSHIFHSSKFNINTVKEVSSLLIEELRRCYVLPNLILSHLLFVSENTSFEILKWINFQMNIIPGFEHWKYLHLICWTSRGRIDYPKTANNINQKLSSDEYNIKATQFYCLDKRKLDVDQILSKWVIILSRLNFGLRFNTHDFIGHIPLYFLCKSEYYLYRSSFLEWMQSSIKADYEEQTEETKSQLFALSFHPMDLACSLISQMGVDEQRRHFRLEDENPNNNILLAFITDWLWQDYFISIFLHFVIPEPELFSSFIENVAFCINKSYPKVKVRHIAMQLLQKNMQCIDFKPYHDAFLSLVYSFRFENEYQVTFNKLLSLLSNNKAFSFRFLCSALEAISNNNNDNRLSDELKIFEKVTHIVLRKQEVFEEFFNEGPSANFYFIEPLFINENFEFVEGILAIMLPSEKIHLCKKELVQCPAFYYMAYEYLIKSDSFEKIDRILSFLFSNDEESVVFYKETQILRQTSMAISDHSVLDDFHVTIINEPWSKLKAIIEWCFKTRDVASYFQKHSSDLRCIVIRLLDRNFRLVDKFLNWIYSSDKEKIQAFKNEFAFSSASENFTNLSYSKIPLTSVDQARIFFCWLNLRTDILLAVRKIINENGLNFEYTRYALNAVDLLLREFIP